MPKDRLLPSPSPPGSEPGTFLFETERLISRRYLLSDAPVLAASADYPSIGSNLRDGFPSPYTLANAEAYIKSHNTGRDTAYPKEAPLFVKPGTPGNPSAEPLFIGCIGIKPGDDVDYRTWDMGYWLTPAAWGQGYMTEAVSAFARFIFATWPTLNRLEACHYGKNPASGNVLQKCGFTKEGVRRGASEKDGMMEDNVMYGLLRSELQ